MVIIRLPEWDGIYQAVVCRIDQVNLMYLTVRCTPGILEMVSQSYPFFVWPNPRVEFDIVQGGAFPFLLSCHNCTWIFRIFYFELSVWWFARYNIFNGPFFRMMAKPSSEKAPRKDHRVARLIPDIVWVLSFFLFSQLKKNFHGKVVFRFIRNLPI